MKRQIQDLAAWIACAALFTGVAFAAATVFDGIRASQSRRDNQVQHEVWTQDAQGVLVPMKEGHQ